MNTIFNVLKCKTTGRIRHVSVCPVVPLYVLFLVFMSGAADTASVKTASADTLKGRTSADSVIVAAVDKAGLPKDSTATAESVKKTDSAEVAVSKSVKKSDSATVTAPASDAEKKSETAPTSAVKPATPVDTVAAVISAKNTDTLITAGSKAGTSAPADSVAAAGVTPAVIPAPGGTKETSTATQNISADRKPDAEGVSALDKKEAGSDSAVVPQKAVAAPDATAKMKSGPFDKLPLSPALKDLLNRYWVYGAIGAGVIVVGVVVGVVVSGGGKGNGGSSGPSGDPDLPPIDIPLPGSR